MNLDLNNLITQIRGKQQQQKLSTSSKISTFKCQVCKDTLWIPGPTGVKRCDCFKKELSANRWKKFGVDPTDCKPIKDYQVTNQEQQEAKRIACNYIMTYDEVKDTRNNSIAFLGNPGMGKTHLALAIGKTLLERDRAVEVVYMPYLEAIRELKSNVMDDMEYIRIQSKYINAELLIIDDLFKDKIKKGKLIGELTEADMKHIYPIINQRYIAKRPTIYNSECNHNMLLDLDEALGSRIIESCKGNIITFKYSIQNNYRLKL